MLKDIQMYMFDVLGTPIRVGLEGDTGGAGGGIPWNPLRTLVEREETGNWAWMSQVKCKAVSCNTLHIPAPGKESTEVHLN